MKTLDLQFEYQERSITGATRIYLNASSLKISGCLRRYGLMVNGYKPGQGWISKESISILETGKAIHHFAEQFTRLSGDVVEAIAQASRKYPQVSRATIIAAGSMRPRINLPAPLILNGEPAVEVTFEIPWYSFVYNGHTYQYILCGTMDHVTFDSGVFKIYDFKSARGKMIEYVLAKYEHDTQFAFYQWVIWKFKARMNIPIEIANEIERGRICSHVVPVQLTLKEPRWTIGPARSLTPEQFHMYEDTLKSMLPILASAYIDVASDPLVSTPNGMLNNSCLYCDYKPLCYATNAYTESVALSQLEKTEYNPLKREEENE
jgi:hypothetical protein